MIHEFEVGLRRYPVGNADEKWFPVWLRRYVEFLNRPFDEELPAAPSLAKKFSRELSYEQGSRLQGLQAVRTLVAYQRIVWKTDTDDSHEILKTLGQLAEAGDMSTASRIEPNTGWLFKCHSQRRSPSSASRRFSIRLYLGVR